jgi:antitoxin component of RelBE/YafQ-DinJ toxin-antitoxin module
MVTKAKSPKRLNVHTIYVKNDVWEKVKPVLDPIGLSRSQFIELMFQATIDSEAKPFAEVQGRLFEDMFTAAKKLHDKKGHMVE